jgi:predicted DNA-binding transcriptional regulator AlpA
MPKLLLTVKDISLMLGLSKSTIYAYADSGLIRSIQLPSVRESKAIKRNKRAIRFTVESVDEFIHNLTIAGFDGRGGE